MGFLMPQAPSMPAPPPIPPAAAPPTLANAATSGAAQGARAKAAGAMGEGFDGTVATSPLGAPAPNTTKSYLGGQ